MHKQAIIFLFLFLSFNTFALRPDSLIFENQQEQKSFSEYLSGQKPGPLMFFCAGDSKSISDIEKILTENTNHLRNSGIDKKPDKKKIKMILNTANKNILKTYKKDATAGDLVNGNFSIPTSVLVYASLLDSFNIDYKIRQTPYDIYIEAGNTQIKNKKISDKLYNYQLDYLKLFVKYLYDNKIIPEDEYYKHGADELFEKYFSTTAYINIYQLAANNYFIQSVFDLQTFQDAESAIKKVEKAVLLFPENYFFGFVFYTLSAAVLQIDNSRGMYKGANLAKFVFGIKNDSLTLQSTGDEYRNYLIHKALDNNMFDECDKMHKDFEYFLNDSAKFSLFDYNFNNVTAYYYYRKEEYLKSLSYAEKAYEFNPENINLKGIIHDDFSKIVYLVSNEGNDQATFDTIKYFFNRYPLLLEYEHLQPAYIGILSADIKNAFLKNKDSTDDAGRAASVANLESFMKTHKDFKYDKDDIYWSAVNIYSYYSDWESDHVNYDSIINIFGRLQPCFPDIDYFPQQIKKAENLKHNPPKRTKTSNVSYETEIITEPAKKYYTASEYKDLVYKNLPGCWKASSFRKYATKETHKTKEHKITAKSSKYVEYFDGEKTLKGRWSLRPKGKLLYFTPSDKSDYLVFRIVKMTDKKMELRPYVNNKAGNKILIFVRCK